MGKRLPTLSALSALLAATLGISAALGQNMGTPRPPTVLTPRGPTAATATRPTPAPAAPAVTVPPKEEFPALATDPIERLDFRSKPHPIKKSLTKAKAMMIQEVSGGIEIGSASDVIAIVPADTRRGTAFDAVFVAKQAEIGKQMRTSFDEAVRAVKMRYPRWEAGKIEFSFQDKYTGHDGGSAGTCFGVLLLSMLEGFEIDDKFAVTGDITVDWSVQKIGGVAEKLRGAAAGGCLYAAIPNDNVSHLGDMALMYGESSLHDIQIFSINSLQDAVALMRTDRAPRIARAMKEFADLQPRLKTIGKAGLSNPAVQKALEQVVEYAPNHQSAKTLLDIGKGSGPKTLSTSFAFEQLGQITYPYRFVIIGIEPPTRETVTPSMTTNARKQLAQIRPLAPRELQPLFTDAAAIVERCELIASKRATITTLAPAVQAFREHARAIITDRAVLESMFRD